MRNEEFENKEFLVRKTDEKNEKMGDQKLSILEAFGGGNDRKFKQNLTYLEENFLKSENLVKNCQIRMQ